MYLKLRILLLFTLATTSSIKSFAQCSGYPACDSYGSWSNQRGGGPLTPSTTGATVTGVQRDGDYIRFNLTAGKTYFFSTSATLAGSNTCGGGTSGDALFLFREG